MNTKYVDRLCILLNRSIKQDIENKKQFKFTVSELREFLDCKDKYTQITGFKTKVLDVAIAELNAHKDYKYLITYKCEKVARRITYITFFLESKYQSPENIEINELFRLLYEIEEQIQQCNIKLNRCIDIINKSNNHMFSQSVSRRIMPSTPITDDVHVITKEEIHENSKKRKTEVIEIIIPPTPDELT